MLMTMYFDVRIVVETIIYRGVHVRYEQEFDNERSRNVAKVFTIDVFGSMLVSIWQSICEMAARAQPEV